MEINWLAVLYVSKEWPASLSHRFEPQLDESIMQTSRALRAALQSQQMPDCCAGAGWPGFHCWITWLQAEGLGIPDAWLSSIPVSGTHQRSCNSPRNNYSSCESKNMCVLPNHWTRQRPPAECFLSLLRAGSEATVSTVASLCFDWRKLKIITNREKNSNHKSNCSALETVERTLN